jgi:high-affinity iron transporter
VLPTFIVGLREGVEASLIVGIIAAFLRQRGGRRELRWVWLGVGLAVALCIGVAVALDALDRNLPQKEQEALESVVAAVAVVMVTSMVVWMARHARQMRGDLERQAGAALATGSVGALVGMAFLAVLREGFETAVFLLAAFQASTSRDDAAGGAILGILVAAVIGVLIYRGGVHINLARFFFVTGLVLVVVAAGLVSFAFHTAHEAGWVNFGQETLVDLTWFVEPGTVRSALVTGVLGIQPKPTVIESVGWLIYLVLAVGYLVGTVKRPRTRAVPTSVTARAA